ncbi:hypothetical protein F511_40543 [Dorcoceras hygrometricum]|uniref:Uncharacterized protein n=1 Tax=Dorcoceras hygrometricum TaxID=472368 RepID=A0A2Z7BLD1_9LAMI|nr:hypothetical protein F511_40543 [Dorcoceras hygrometricum]
MVLGDQLLFPRGAVRCCITTIECRWRMLVELFPVLSCSSWRMLVELFPVLISVTWIEVGGWLCPLEIPCDLAGGFRAGATMSHSIFHWVRSGFPGCSAGRGDDPAEDAPGGLTFLDQSLNWDKLNFFDHLFFVRPKAKIFSHFSQRSGFQSSEVSGVRELSLSEKSGLQPTQVDVATGERDDVLTGGDCTVSLLLLPVEKLSFRE